MTGSEIEKQAQVALAYLHTLRDEIRLLIPLADPGLQRLWSELEPQFSELEHRVRQAGPAVLTELHVLTIHLEGVRTKLHPKDSGMPSPGPAPGC